MKGAVEESTTTVTSNGRYSAYPEYKDSGVEWLGHIPKHWELRRLKFCAQINPSKSELETVEESKQATFLPMENVSEDGEILEPEFRQIGDVIDDYTYFRENDVLIAKITPCFENGKGALARNLKNGVGFGTTEFVVVRPNNVLHNKFYFYLTRSHLFRKVGEGVMKGAAGQKRVPEEFFRDFPQFLPRKSEQQSIVKFLDRETGKIDRLIERKEELIDLLGEKRTALITEAVTQGLDPDVEMKESGIEWLEEVPEHWNEEPLKYNFSFEKGKNAQEFTQQYISEHDGEYPVYSGQTGEEGIMGYIDSYEYDVEKVIFVTTVGAKAMTPMLLKGKFNLSQNCLIMEKLNEDIHVEYFYYLMFPLFEYKKGSIPSDMQSSLRISDLKKFSVISPPLSEQETIAEFLNVETEKIDAFIEKIEGSIKLLKEYRTALITAAVTGKIDVRDEV